MKASPMTNRTLAEVLIADIDILIYKPNKIRMPVEYQDAARELLFLVTDDETWEQIFALADGARTNYVLHALGDKRTRWLKEYRRGLPS